jgi:hypothetical protein
MYRGFSPRTPVAAEEFQGFLHIPGTIPLLPQPYCRHNPTAAKTLLSSQHHCCHDSVVLMTTVTILMPFLERM